MTLDLTRARSPGAANFPTFTLSSTLAVLLSGVFLLPVTLARWTCKHRRAVVRRRQLGARKKSVAAYGELVGGPSHRVTPSVSLGPQVSCKPLRTRLRAWGCWG